MFLTGIIITNTIILIQRAIATVRCVIRGANSVLAAAAELSPLD